MADTQHAITVKPTGRVEIECQKCKTSMEVSDSPLGAALLIDWPKLHKCPKPVRWI